MTAVTTDFEGVAAIRLLTESASVVVLPSVGGKIVSVFDRLAGRELLWRSGRPFRPQTYGQPWTDFDMSGWEDCCPTIAPCPYPDWPWADTPLPEHGELFTLPWQAAVNGDSARLWTHGVRLPYRFEKTLSLTGSTLRLRHRLENLSPFSLRYLWATHPLLAARPGQRIVLPAGTRVCIDSSVGGRLGRYLDWLDWPNATDAAGQAVALDRLTGVSAGSADKLYTAPLTAGWCELRDPTDDYTVAFRWDINQLPQLGIWINQGGWPTAADGIFHVALEPTNGYPDRLDVAVARGSAGHLDGHSIAEWTVELQFGSPE